jgi:glycosyltransferase involved in cell wall biosynthesis
MQTDGITRRARRSRPRFLFLTAALDATGGIPSYSRAMIRALGDVGDTTVVDLTLSGSRRDQATGFLRAVVALVRVRPDLLVLGHVGFGPIGLLWHLLRGRWAVVTYGIEVWGAPSRLRSATFERADAVWPISSFTADEVRRVTPGARLVPALGGNIDRAFFQSHESVAGPFRALVVCRLVDLRHKGLDTAIDAVQLLAADVAAGRPVQLRIAGTGPAAAELDALIAARDAAGAVRALGRLDDDELRAEYRQADVVILISRHERGATPRGEGLGLVVLEAAAAGTTAVAAKIGGSADIVVDGETGFLVDAADPDALAGALRVLLTDPDRCTRMGKAACDLVRREHTVDAFAERVRAAVEQTLERR